MDNIMARMLKGLALTVFIIILDQLTKNYAVQELILHQPVPLFSGFNFTLMHNTGAAFSFLNQVGSWFFITLASAVSIFIVVWMTSLPSNKRWLFFALAFVLGGALGNLWDRVALGYVIDFIDVSLGFMPWRIFNPWPAFNIADSAIFIGAVMLIIDAIWIDDSENDG
ncbi:MAG TPA: signal peptidase II [Thiotrichaceae bacterium]|jgi:signal peptidase II|nr:signal peptidase II [Thiotrichaceae bacterium]HIM07688.1 signal peptidase II [Gammaproteobacteria bacterium]